MSAYMITQYKVDDADLYAEYRGAVGETLMAHGAKIHVAGDYTVLEGSPHPVIVVVEFPSKADAEAWYNSPEYQAIIHKRHNSTSDGWMVVTEDD